EARGSRRPDDRVAIRVTAMGAAMKVRPYRTARVAGTFLALLFPVTESFAQDAPDDAPTASGTQFLVLGNAEGRGGAANGSSFIVRNDAASASIFLGSSSKPVALKRIVRISGHYVSS